MKCSMPYTNLEIRNDGTFGPCCINVYSYKKDNGENFNIKNDNIEDVWNSIDRNCYAKQLDKEDLKECHDCWKIEKTGGYSKRKLENDIRKDYIGKFPRSLDIKLGNICNLKCVICSPFNSSSWYSDYEKLYSKKFDNTNYKWIFDKNLINSLKKYVSHAEIIELYGGEPLSLKGVFDILNYCVTQKTSKIQDIRINTNGTIKIDETMLSIFSKFKSVGLNWSIDSFEKNEFEYQRYPASFDEVHDNLISVINKKTKNINIGITYTVNVMNIYSIHTALNFARKYNTMLHLNILSGPKFLRFNNLLMEDVRDYLNQLNDNDVNQAGIKIHELAKFNQLTESYENLKSLKKYLENLDKIRSIDYKNTFEHLKYI